MATQLLPRAARIIGGRIIGWALLLGSLMAVGLLVPRVFAPPLPMASASGGVPRVAPEAAAEVPLPNDVQALADAIAAPQRYAALTPDGAIRRNARMPFALGSVPLARPFLYPRADPIAYARALGCMTAAIYYEAANEPDAGQAAVAQVVLNRVRSPIYPRTVCGVVFQGAERRTGCQFTFTCDGALARVPQFRPLARARAVAEAALSGRIAPTVGWSTHYHAVTVLPLWAGTLAKTTQIGQHIFYRIPGSLGAPSAFAQSAISREPEIAALLVLGLSVAAAPPSPTTALIPMEASTRLPAAVAVIRAPVETRPKGPPLSLQPGDAAAAQPISKRGRQHVTKPSGYFSRPEGDRDRHLPM